MPCPLSPCQPAVWPVTQDGWNGWKQEWTAKGDNEGEIAL